jgi:hypothetical protein
MHFKRKAIVDEIITYIGVRVRNRVVLWRSSLGHEAQPGEVASLLFVVDLLIVFWTWWVFTWEVKVAQGYTCSGHDVLLLLIPEVILLLVVILVVVVVLVMVVLLPLRALDDEVGGVTALKASLEVLGDTPPLLLKLVHRPKFQESWDGVGGVSIMATNTSTSNQSFTNKGSIMIRMTFARQFMILKLDKQFLCV